jgi:TolA-binding protein
MKVLRSLLTSIVAFALVAPALAQCPPPVAGSTPEEIKANEQRLLCMQRELSLETSRRSLEMDINALNRRLRELQTRQQLQSLDFEVPVYTPRT